jgi:hypothetical protein
MRHRFVFLGPYIGLDLQTKTIPKAACKRRLLGRVETRKRLEVETQASGRTKKTAETRKRLCGKGNQVNQVLSG